MHPDESDQLEEQATDDELESTTGENSFNFTNSVLSAFGLLFEFFCDATLWITNRLENGFQTSKSWFFPVAEAADPGENWVNRLIEISFTPFALMWRGLSAFGSNSVVGVAIRCLGVVTLWILSPLWIPTYFISVLSTTRSPLFYRLAFVATIVLVGPLLWIGWYFLRPGEEQIALMYRQAISKAVDEQQFDLVDLYYQKLRQLGTTAEQFDLRTADQLIKSGHIQEAFSLVERIAPRETTGLAAGHFWIIRQLLQHQSPYEFETSIILADLHLGHLKKTIKTPIEPIEVTFVEALLRLRQGRLRESVAKIDKLKDRYWPAAVIVLELNYRLGNSRNAKTDLARIDEFIRLTPSHLDSVQPQFFKIWSDVALSARDQQTYLRVVEIWNQRFPNDRSAAEQLIWLKLNTFVTNHVGSSTNTPLETLRSLNEIALFAGIKNRDLIVHWLSGQLSNSSERNILGPALRTVSSPAGLSSILCEIVGTTLANINSPDLARRYLQWAVEVDDKNAIAYNNLAYVLNRYYSDEQNSAMDYANRAVTLAPDNLDFRVTRGMLFSSMKRWDDAINDLELAVNSNPNWEIHAKLAEAYHYCGNSHLAAYHQGQVEKLRPQSP